MTPARRDAVVVGAVALAARLAVVGWAASRFPPTADGTYYQKIAERIASGAGSTWLWPDGAVTYVAHYPVGYPALLGAVYAALGTHVVAAMILNALLGAAGAVAAHRLGVESSRRTGVVAGALVALHPALVLYTPAIMTEGVTAALITVLAAAAVVARATCAAGRRPMAALVALGALGGVATLVRPQSILLVPAFAAAAAWSASAGAAPGRALRRTAVWAGIALASCLLVVAPWTARNCVRMHRCALVSVNGGWNLLIGADPASTGAWAEIQVPPACREVWDEAEKDVCFERAARGQIAADPLGWLAKAPSKLAATFDYGGAAPWYLHASNPAALGDRGKITLGALETVATRVTLLLAVAAAWRASRAERTRPRVALGIVLGAAGLVGSFLIHAWIAYLAFVGLVAITRRPPLGIALAALAVGATAATHAVFFGAGRYGLVVLPLVAVAAAGALERRGL